MVWTWEWVRWRRVVAPGRVRVLAVYPREMALTASLMALPGLIVVGLAGRWTRRRALARAWRGECMGCGYDLKGVEG